MRYNGCMTKVAIISTLLFAVACGDNIDPGPRVETWGDAEAVWAEAWCSYTGRCYPEDLALFYDTHEECVADVIADNCTYRQRTGFPDCDTLFPQIHVDEIEQCGQEMADLTCGATRAPDICFTAFSESK